MAIYIFNYLSMPLYAKVFNRKSFCIIASLQMFLILALRADSVGVDFVTYKSAFDYISSIGFTDMLSRIRIFKTALLPYPYDLESGWMVLNWIVGFIGFDFRAIIVICAAINMYTIGKFIYKFSYTPWLSFCVVTSIGTYQYMFGVLRQSLALSLVVLAIDAYYEDNKEKALLLWIISFFVHRTAILAAILFAIIKWNNTSKYKYKISIFLWIPFITVAPLIYNKVIAPIMNAVGKGGYAGHGLRLNNMIVLLLLIGISTVLFYRFENISTSMEALFVWSVVISIYWTTMGLFNDTLSRSKEYFSFFLALEIPMVLFYYKQKKIAVIGKAVMFVLLFAYMCYTLNGSELIPYSVFF